MTTLVVGATGATGRHLVDQLLISGQKVKVIVRPGSNVPDHWKNNKDITIMTADLLKIPVADLASFSADCDAYASCLGHTPSFKGIYGHPRKLVTDSVKLMTEAISLKKPNKPVKFVLMNTVANWNRDLNEPINYKEKAIIGFLRLVLPPHPDNEKAADFLRVNIGQNNPIIEWVAVRPDSLVNESEVTEYDIHPSPIRSALFNPGKISRINVGNFMANLITDDVLWQKWKGQMPVIYNKVSD